GCARLRRVERRAGGVEHTLADIREVALDQRSSRAHVTAAAKASHDRGRIDGRLPLRRAAGDFDAARLLVEKERDAHPTRTSYLLDEAGDVLVPRLRALDVARADLRPNELAALLAHQAGEGEAPELQGLEALVAEDVVRDRLQVGPRFAKSSRAVESARVGARELERPCVGHDPDERGGRHLRRPLDPE